MAKKIDIKKIIDDNPAIDEKEFRRFHKLLEERKKAGIKGVEYDILPPFTTKRQIKKSSE
jgi:hypothetical protein